MDLAALTLRTLQTLAEVATEHNSTLVLPIPIDVLDAVRERVQPATAPDAAANPSAGTSTDGSPSSPASFAGVS